MFVCLFGPWFLFGVHISIYIYIYIHTHTHICVCVCLGLGLTIKLQLLCTVRVCLKPVLSRCFLTNPDFRVQGKGLKVQGSGSGFPSYKMAREVASVKCSAGDKEPKTDLRKGCSKELTT